jgi:hypothetical protein
MEEMQIEHIKNPELFFNTVDLHLLPGYTLFQNPRWMSITYPGCNLSAFVSRDESGIRAYGLAIERSSTARIFFGPLAPDEETAVQFGLSIARHYRKKGFGLFCLLPCCEKSPDNRFFSAFDEGGFKPHKGSMIRNWSSLILELDALLGDPSESFSNNHRRSIKKFLDAGCMVKEISSNEDVAALAQIFTRMYMRRKISLPFPEAEKTFKEIFGFFREQRAGSILGAYNKEGRLAGGIILGNHGDHLFYHYGASDPEEAGMPVLHAVFDRAIRSAREAGFRYFDFGGYDVTAKENSQLAHINRFKEGFHGKLVHYEDVLDIPLNPLKYTIIKGGLWLRNKIKK